MVTLGRTSSEIATAILCQTQETSMDPNSSIWVHFQFPNWVCSDQSTEFHNSLLQIFCHFFFYLKDLNLVLMCHSHRESVLLGQWPWSPQWWRAFTIVFLRTSTLGRAGQQESSRQMSGGFLQTSLSMLLLRLAEILYLQPRSDLSPCIW